MAEPMTDERLAELHEYAASSGLSIDEQAELLAEVERLRARQGTPRVQYGVRYPHHDTIPLAPDQERARNWVEEYARLDPESPPARVQRRTVTRSATDWEDVDG